MFRKKKQGSVTVLDDDADDSLPHDSLPHDSLPHDAPPRHSLPLDSLPPPAAAPPASDKLDQMTESELQQLALNTARAGKQSTVRALQVATEARQIGIDTAENMQQQTQQLEKMSEEIEVVHDYLDKSEQILDSMSKPKLVRMFQRKKATGKGLNKVKGDRKEVEAREGLRAQGVDAVDMRALQNGRTQPSSVDIDELNRDKLFDSAQSSSKPKLWRSSKRNGNAPQQSVRTKKIEEDYSQYSSGVAEVMQQQDEDLDQIGDALKDMKVLANAMNNELEYQNKMITEVQDFSAETSRRTKDNARKIAKLK